MSGALSLLPLYAFVASQIRLHFLPYFSMQTIASNLNRSQPSSARVGQTNRLVAEKDVRYVAPFLAPYIAMA